MINTSYVKFVTKHINMFTYIRININKEKQFFFRIHHVNTTQLNVGPETKPAKLGWHKVWMNLYYGQAGLA